MKIAIIGGGLTGLSAAEILSNNHEITLFEKNSYLGGLASSFEYKGKKIPMHYHHVFAHDNTTKEYMQKYGLNLTWKKIKMGILVNEKIYNFTNPLALMNFSYLTLYGRMRYGMFGSYVYTLLNPDNIPEDQNAEEWLNQVAGKEVTEKLFTPLYARNKFNIPLSQISAKQFANRLTAKEATGNFGYPTEGLDAIIDAFEETLLKNNVKIIKNATIQEIDCKNTTIDGEKFDKIVITIPLPSFLKRQKNLDEEIVSKISKIKYCPCVSVVFGTEKLLSDHYWINILNKRVHMLMQHSYLYDGYDTKVTWALRYGGSEEDLELTDEQIVKEYMNMVTEQFPVEIKWTKVFREKYASPIYDKDFHRNMPPKQVNNIYFSGIAVTYPKIRNMNTALLSGREVAGLILKDTS
ncbi:MAG: FAD-dependent oxidoreductase [archaeon]